MTLTAEVEGEAVASAVLERRFIAPDVRQVPVREHGLVGTLFHPAGGERVPGILVFGGSGGGLRWADLQAPMLASRGYTVLALAYFAFEHLPEALIDIPLEYFETALGWLQAHPAVQGDELGVMGISRGGELALLLGATFADVKAVVAYVPSAVVWSGLRVRQDPVAEMVAPPLPSWTYRGVALPVMRNHVTREQAAAIWGTEPVALTPGFLINLADAAAVEAAAIPVERIGGPVLVISAEDDQMWPSSAMSEMVIRRLEAHRHPYPFKHLSYAGTGHMLGLPHLPTTVFQARHPIAGRVVAFGGNPKDQAFARADSWRQVLTFLAEHVR